MDLLGKKKRSDLMKTVHGKNTKPELLLRKQLYAAGFRYRIHYGTEQIDIAFPSKRLAIFVDGCFWHMCPKHRSYPKSNVEYWIPKLKRNVERDREKNNRLKKVGWRVLRFWEHEVERDLTKCIGRIREAIK